MPTQQKSKMRENEERGNQREKPRREMVVKV